MNMNQGAVRSGLAAAAIAIVVWLVIMFLIGNFSGGSQALGALILAIFTFVATWAITTYMERRNA